MADKKRNGLELSARPFGPTQEQLAAVGERVLKSADVRKSIGAGKVRLLYVEVLDDGAKTTKPLPPSRFRATLYDDTNHRAILVDGSLRDARRLEITESAVPPHPSAAEYAAAVSLVRRDAALGRAIDVGQLAPYRPIPALALNELPDGRIERRVAVGLLPRRGEAQHEVVAVDVARGAVHRLEERLPSNLRPRNRSACGVPLDAGQATASKGTAGQVWVTVTQAGKTLWRFLVIRPAASSGTNGSGIELRYVDYKGKRVLYRAHVPILNVKYTGDACGPYRDWHYQEGMIRAAGTDVAPGFRLCPAPAQTIIDTGSDTGNFLGVGIYITGSEVVFVSEMEAGWYRYISEWRLHADGTIRPRFAFAAVEQPCVCNVHHHHVYWRFDFDIRSAGNNRVREFNDPPLSGSSKWHDKRFEVRRLRDFSRQRRWLVEHTRTKEGYEIIPNADDGIAATAPDCAFRARGRLDHALSRQRDRRRRSGHWTAVRSGPRRLDQRRGGSRS